jgi:hypothetical protein
LTALTVDEYAGAEVLKLRSLWLQLPMRHEGAFILFVGAGLTLLGIVGWRLATVIQ